MNSPTSFGICTIACPRGLGAHGSVFEAAVDSCVYWITCAPKRHPCGNAGGERGFLKELRAFEFGVANGTSCKIMKGTSMFGRLGRLEELVYLTIIGFYGNDKLTHI